MGEYGILLTDMDVELLLDVFSEFFQSKVKEITVYHSHSSLEPQMFSQQINPYDFTFTGLFSENVVDMARKLQYLVRTENDIVLIHLGRDIAAYTTLGSGDVINDAESNGNDIFYLGCKIKEAILGQVREAVDSRCTTTGAENSDADAMRNKAIRLDAVDEYVYFECDQNIYLLPKGSYELIARMKAEQADTVKMDVLNMDDLDNWTLVFDASAQQILCSKVFSMNEKLYVGTNDGKIYVSEDAETFVLAYDTGQEEVLSFEEHNNCLYAGTGDSGKIYKYNQATWIEDYDTGETKVYTLKSFSGSLYAGTGGNGKIFIYTADTWSEHSTLSGETTIFALEEYKDWLYAASGDNGKIYKIGAQSLDVDTEYVAPGSDPSGLTWDGSVIWSCDRILNKIYKHNADMTVNTTYDAPSYDCVGLAWDGSVIWSCDRYTDKIYKHNADMTVNTTYNAPYTGIFGLTWDGSRIWSCDYNIDKIYKHNVDMTVDISYNSPSAIPSGLAWDGSRIWSCDYYPDKVYKHNADMTVDITYNAPSTNIWGLTWDGSRIWSCDTDSNKIYKHKSFLILSYDASDTYIYTLKTFGDYLYAGGDAGIVYKFDNSSWSSDYSSGEDEIRSLYEHAATLYAGTGTDGKIFILNDSWALLKNLEYDTHIYTGVSFLNQHLIGTGNDGRIYVYRDGILATAQKTLTTTYALYKLPFNILDYDLEDTIRFQITKDGSVASWVNIDFLSFVAKK